jgi:hypothetical protein
MKRFAISMSFIAFALAGFCAAQDFPQNFISLAPAKCPLTRTLDEAEPDTLFYDDNEQGFVITTVSNYYVFVRFTPLAAFELRSIYVGIRDDIGSALPCSVWVHRISGSQLGEQLAVVTGAVQQGLAWYDITLASPINFDANQDFAIVVGRAPGWTTGWSPLIDGASTVNRSYIGIGSRISGPYQAIPYDFKIRAGGVYATFADLAVVECFNRVNEEYPRFHVSVGDRVTFRADVENRSDEPASSFTMRWQVRDVNGSVVFDHQFQAGSIESHTCRTLDAASPLVFAEAGEYIVTATVISDNDADSTNNSSDLRMFVGPLPDWYRYDDLEMDGAAGHLADWAVGLAYRPSHYPAKIESVRVYCGSAGNPTLSIYRNDLHGRPDIFTVWTGTRSCEVGTNTFAVTPPITLFRGESFTAGFGFDGAIVLGMDTDPPNAATMSGMGPIAWLLTPGGWIRDATANWMIHAYLDTSHAAPVDPFIYVSPADTLRFGSVDVSGSATETISLRIINVCETESLHVTGLVFEPTDIQSAFTATPGYVAVDGQDSITVQIVFDPSEIRSYNGSVVLTNDSYNLPVCSLAIQAEGITGSSVNPEHPAAAFALLQNYPNPFNARTEIRFELLQAAHVELTVFDVAGREVRRLLDDERIAGLYHTAWDGRSSDGLPAATGIYFCRLRVGDWVDARKMMLIR